MIEQENFWTLIHSAAHWELELVIMFLCDGVIGLLVWPRLKRFATHHKSDDKKIEELEAQVREMREILGLEK